LNSSPARLGTNLAQRLDEALAIRVIQEDRLPPVVAIQDVINRAGIFDSLLAGHRRHSLLPPGERENYMRDMNSSHRKMSKLQALQSEATRVAVGFEPT
jgi:hypothetical protein